MLMLMLLLLGMCLEQSLRHLAQHLQLLLVFVRCSQLLLISVSAVTVMGMMICAQSRLQAGVMRIVIGVCGGTAAVTVTVTTTGA